MVTIQTPYAGIFGTIPGTIEAEKYDLGGQGIAYNDVTTANEGGAFRTDAVDVEPFGTGYDVGYIITDEWLEYSVNVTAGTYKIDANVAAIAAGKTFRLELDGTTIASFTVPNTGAWGTFQVTTVNNVTLTAGQKVLRIYATSGDFNVDNITFSAVNSVTTNAAPTVALALPASNTAYTAPASISISAHANDSDGSISKVEFFNGTQKLGEDLTDPYTYTWTNAGAGTYSITAKATDNAGATTSSAQATISVSPSVTNNTCTGIGTYIENGGYIAGSLVQKDNKQYQCKPFPYSGWCNGAAWAYMPGTGAYWTDAWTLVGNCTSARVAEQATVNETLLNNVPNPFSALTTIALETEEAGEVTIAVYNKTGQLVQTLSQGYLNAGIHEFAFDASHLRADIYLIKCNTQNGVLTRKIVKTE